MHCPLTRQRFAVTNTKNMTPSKLIKAGQTLSARSICDHNCIFSCTVLSRTAKMATVKVDRKEKRVKIHTDTDGVEFIFALGQFSMAPIFRAA